MSLGRIAQHELLKAGWRMTHGWERTSHKAPPVQECPKATACVVCSAPSRWINPKGKRQHPWCAHKGEKHPHPHVHHLRVRQHGARVPHDGAPLP